MSLSSCTNETLRKYFVRFRDVIIRTMRRQLKLSVVRVAEGSEAPSKRLTLLKLVQNGILAVLMVASAIFTLKTFSFHRRFDGGPDSLRRALSRRSIERDAGQQVSASVVHGERFTAHDHSGDRALELDSSMQVDYDELEREDRERMAAIAAAAAEEAQQQHIDPNSFSADVRSDVAQAAWETLDEQQPLAGASRKSGKSPKPSASNTKRSTPTPLASSSTLPASYKGDFGMDEAGAKIAELKSRPFHANKARPEVVGAYKANDNDIRLQEDDEKSPLEGIAIDLPTGRVLPDDPQIVAAREASEAAAEVAVVVITGPRSATMNKDKRHQQYFRSNFDCDAKSKPYRILDCSKVDIQACAALCAAACDDDPACEGFHASGFLLDHVDAPSCGVPSRTTLLDGSQLAYEKGLFLKHPLPVVPVPQRVVITDKRTGEPVEWWKSHQMDVVGRDLGHHNKPPVPGPNPEARAQGSGIFDACGDNPDCKAFNYPDGWLKSGVDVRDLTVMKRTDIILYTKERPPPMDYVTSTVVSLMQEMGGEKCDADGAFGGKVHVYVVDASKREWHGVEGGEAAVKANPRIALRGPQAEDYWFRAFAWLRRRYGHRPCVTFLPANGYTRLKEVAFPAHGRGMPAFQSDNQGKKMQRGQVTQTLDFVSGIRHAAAHSPGAHVFVSEDDNHFCTGIFTHLASSVKAVARFDPQWGALKVGNGGSAILFQADLVPNLLTYLTTRRGSDNVDVSMWRYLHSGQHSDYLSRTTLSAHRGLQSSFKLGFIPVWQRVKCGGELDFYWGHYRDCDAGWVGKALQAAGDAADEDIARFMSQWRCSVWSPGSDGIMPHLASKSPSPQPLAARGGGAVK